MSNVTVLPVAADPRAGACAAALGAALPYAVPNARPRSAEHLLMTSARVTPGARMPWQDQAAVKQPSLGSALSLQDTSSTTYIHAIRAAANGGGQSGSLPAWDPV